jgi:hypothetical protein
MHKNKRGRFLDVKPLKFESKGIYRARCRDLVSLVATYYLNN